MASLLPENADWLCCCCVGETPCTHSLAGDNLCLILTKTVMLAGGSLALTLRSARLSLQVLLFYPDGKRSSSTENIPQAVPPAVGPAGMPPAAAAGQGQPAPNPPAAPVPAPAQAGAEAGGSLIVPPELCSLSCGSHSGLLAPGPLQALQGKPHALVDCA